MLPLVPVMLMVAIPSEALAVAVNFNALVVVVEAGVNVAVTPPGIPFALKATLPLKTPCGATVTVVDPEPPWTIVGESAESEKSFNGGCTVRLMLVVCVSPPLVPVINTDDDISAALLDAAKVTVLKVPVAEAGLKVAVTPLGKLLALKATPPANPPILAMFTVLVLLPPWLTLDCEGLAAKEKSGVITASRMAMEEVIPPPVPITVTVAFVPTGTVLATLKVTTPLAPVTVAGFKVAVTPVGNPLTLNVTGLLKPPAALIAMVLATLVPCTTLILSGLAAR